MVCSKDALNIPLPVSLMRYTKLPLLFTRQTPNYLDSLSLINFPVNKMLVAVPMRMMLVNMHLCVPLIHYTTLSPVHTPVPKLS